MAKLTAHSCTHCARIRCRRSASPPNDPQQCRRHNRFLFTDASRAGHFFSFIRCTLCNGNQSTSIREVLIRVVLDKERFVTTSITENCHPHSSIVLSSTTFLCFLCRLNPSHNSDAELRTAQPNQTW